MRAEVNIHLADLLGRNFTYSNVVSTSHRNVTHCFVICVLEYAEVESGHVLGLRTYIVLQASVP